MRIKTIKNIRVNNQIQAKDVLVLDEDGNKLGMMPLSEAIFKARNQQLDLVEISSNNGNTVCKIIDSGKYKYDLQKNEASHRRSKNQTSLKEVQFRPNIDKNDVAIKKAKIINFISSGHPVKIVMSFKGRENAHKEFGTAIIEKMISEIDHVHISSKTMNHNQIIVHLSPSKIEKDKNNIDKKISLV